MSNSTTFSAFTIAPAVAKERAHTFTCKPAMPPPAGTSVKKRKKAAARDWFV